jgi:hypothetical protein
VFYGHRSHGGCLTLAVNAAGGECENLKRDHVVGPDAKLSTRKQSEWQTHPCHAPDAGTVPPGQGLLDWPGSSAST